MNSTVKGAVVSLAILLAPMMGTSQEIDRYNLPDSSLYVLRQPELTMQGHWSTLLVGVVRIYAGSVISIRFRHCEDGVLWYRATRLEANTLDRSRHIEGWIRASDIEEGGLSHFDSLRKIPGPPVPCLKEGEVVRPQDDSARHGWPVRGLTTHLAGGREAGRPRVRLLLRKAPNRAGWPPWLQQVGGLEKV